ncbi:MULTISPECIES: VOC family protein [Sutcliffiella]|uniref:Glyoxalase/fosfomycin resistance/dioxygenase domain-containing protein n=1 Tax=Sutcliffiella cohnii TaxID=33932 RepID=A0A223KMY1_9BACI|nr:MULTISPECIES: VOC family protein [Sutcliffiella]AST90851.1 hypothetical protein BC6307_05900 [Sutcliffiella cohnii]WBL16635.1 VOC family protein [Sutcliffiella sp. NC1]
MDNVKNASPIQSKVGAIFIPVRDVKKAKTWYCKMLGIPETDKEELGHLFVLPLEGVDVILDEMPMWSNKETLSVYKAPAFMFKTENINTSYEYMKKMGADLVTEVQNSQWFVCKDLDGNHIMICQ